MKRFNRVSLLIISVFTLCLSNALATVQLRLSDGTVAGTVVIVDQGPGDSNAAPGAVLYIGPVGPNWTVNVSSGLSKPNVGNALVPQFDLGTAHFSTDRYRFSGDRHWRNRGRWTDGGNYDYPELG